MNYKNLLELTHVTDMRDNQSGHFTQKCPWCKIVQLQVDARANRGRCWNPHCTKYKKWVSIEAIYNACKKLL